jgi:uncharacterized damage-inducible protein DinB
MDARLGPILLQLQLNEGLFKKSMADMSEIHASTQIEGGGNSAAWIAGHLASYRFELAKPIGLKLDDPFGKLYAYGCEIQDKSAYPPLADIMATYDTVCEAIKVRLENLTASDLDRETDAHYTAKEPTVINSVAFLTFHETYHVGQLSYIRKLLGYPSIVG